MKDYAYKFDRRSENYRVHKSKNLNRCIVSWAFQHGTLEELRRIMIGNPVYWDGEDLRISILKDDVLRVKLKVKGKGKLGENDFKYPKGGDPRLFDAMLHRMQCMLKGEAAPEPVSNDIESNDTVNRLTTAWKN